MESIAPAAEYERESAPTSNPTRRTVIDHEALERLRAGDEAAFDGIFRAHYPLLVEFAERLIRERALAEEVAQEVMVELWRRRESLVVQESLRAYLLRATRNRALNLFRHERVEHSSRPFLRGASSTPPTGTSRIEEEEIDAALRDAVSSLPPRCREVFELSRGQKLKYAEIATILGISTKAVEAQMGRALRILRVRLARWLPADGDP